MFMAIMIAAFSMVACSSDSREDEVPGNPQDKKNDFGGLRRSMGKRKRWYVF